jgi:hypothetical protein
MIAALNRADDLLRGAHSTTAEQGGLRELTALLVGCGLAYGAVMGSFGGIEGERALQLVYSAVKVPLLLLAAFGLSLPSYFVLNTLFGLRADFGVALRALLASQASLTIILVSLAPLTLFWYASSSDYPQAILFNALMFAAASAGGQVVLWRGYQPLMARHARHRWMLRVWLVLYAFVGIQLGWVLRPFIGALDQPVRFFREDSWGNAYVILAKMIAAQLAP